MLEKGLPQAMVKKIIDFNTDIKNNQEAEISNDLEIQLGRRPANLMEGLKILFQLKKKHTMKIILTGSLGNVSKPLTIDLIQKGHQVTVISTNADKQKDIEALGASAAIGSLNDLAFLTDTFNNADAVYCMIPPNFKAPHQLDYYKNIGNNYLEAIKTTNVQRVVHLSSWGAHLEKGTGPILGSHHVEKLLNTVPNIAITHIRPGSYYYNLLNFLHMIKSSGIMGSNYGGNDKIVWADAHDIAEAVAEELTKDSTSGITTRYVASDERTANETAEIIGKAIGKPDLKWLTFTNEQSLEGMLKSGMSKSLAQDLVDLGESIHNGSIGTHYESNKPATFGKVKVEDYAKIVAAAYLKN